MTDARAQQEAMERSDGAVREGEALRHAVEELTARMASLELAVEKMEAGTGGSGDGEALPAMIQQLIDGQETLIQLAQDAESRTLAQTGSGGVGGGGG